MQLSTKGRYGVRLMLDLAIFYGNGPVTLKDVAKRQEISEKYLGHLIPALKNAGLVTSVRGAHGGYALARAPKTINLLAVVSALEGSLSLAECARRPSACRRSAACIVREVWQEASAKMLEYLASVDLERLAERQKRRQDTFSYAI
jgi:Rrf2 family protein